MSEMEQPESFERIFHGLKAAADSARKLARLQKNGNWTKTAFGFEALLARARDLERQGVLTRQETLGMIDTIVDKKIISAGSSEVQ